MTDTFFSGWGVCAGKKNVMVVICETWEQAEAVRRAACERSEMQRVTIMRTMPRDRVGVLYSVKTFSDLSGTWLDYYRQGVAA